MDAADTLAEVLKGEGLRVLATLARTIGDLAVAEDALSEATITALDAWPETGIPDNPRAWLAVVARRKALDLLRRESARAAKETAATWPLPDHPGPRSPSPITGRRSPTPSASDSHSHSPRLPQII
jgi:predicted RNA polymerase sigma factor